MFDANTEISASVTAHLYETEPSITCVHGQPAAIQTITLMRSLSAPQPSFFINATHEDGRKCQMHDDELLMYSISNNVRLPKEFQRTIRILSKAVNKATKSLDQDLA